MMCRSLGDGVSVSVLGVGCGRVGSVSNPVPMREVAATLESAIEAGINLFDTADIYGQGDSERALGRLLRRYHDRMFVVTKVGGRYSPCSGLVRLAKPLLWAMARSRPNLRKAVVAARTSGVVHDFSARDLRQAVEASRRRLGLDQLHGLLLHSPSAEALHRPEIHDFLGEMLRGDKALRVGASVDSIAALAAATAIPAVSIIQAPMEVVEALPAAAALLNAIRQRGIAVFVRGVLRLRNPDAGGARSPGQALRSAIALDFVTAAIVGVSTRLHLRDLLSSIA